MYSLQGVGPKIPQIQKNKTNFDTYKAVLDFNGGRCFNVTDFLKLPKWKGSKEIFDKMDMLTTVSSAQERELYQLRNLKYVDEWLELSRLYAEIPRDKLHDISSLGFFSLAEGAEKSILTSEELHYLSDPPKLSDRNLPFTLWFD